MNWSHPIRYIATKSEGFANLYPTTNNIQASVASGIIFKTEGIARAQVSSKQPWRIVDSFVLAPNVMLAELRTITCVTGNSAYESRNNVSNTLGVQLTVCRCDTFIRIEFISSFNAQKRFKTSNDRKGKRYEVDIRITKLRKIRERKLIEKTT